MHLYNFITIADYKGKLSLLLLLLLMFLVILYSASYFFILVIYSLVQLAAFVLKLCQVNFL